MSQSVCYYFAIHKSSTTQGRHNRPEGLYTDADKRSKYLHVSFVFVANLFAKFVNGNTGMHIFTADTAVRCRYKV
jgi:hypothetical protein